MYLVYQFVELWRVGTVSLFQELLHQSVHPFAIIVSPAPVNFPGLQDTPIIVG